MKTIKTFDGTEILINAISFVRNIEQGKTVVYKKHSINIFAREFILWKSLFDFDFVDSGIFYFEIVTKDGQAHKFSDKNKLRLEYKRKEILSEIEYFA